MASTVLADGGFELVGHDLVPLLEIDFAIKDAKDLYAERGPALYMTNPWWERTNRHLLLNHMGRLYEYASKYKLSYKDAVRFNNRTVYHLFPSARVVVREISQSVGSTTLRAHFRDLSKQFTGWPELFELEARFWAVQKGSTGNLDPSGAITKIGNKRAYTLWELLDSVRKIAREKGLEPVDLLDYVLAQSKPCNAWKASTQLGVALARGAPTIRAALPTIRAQRQFAGLQTRILQTAPANTWLQRLGFPNAKLTAGSLPLGFSLAREHLGQRGKSEDVVEVTPQGQYRTRDGALFQGEFWFQGMRNQWMVIQVNEKNAALVDFDSWYNPARHQDSPTVDELTKLSPGGTWTRVWDPKTGRPLSPQAGRISLKLK